MEYQHLLKALAQNGFTRIEKDDRLLDVFPFDIKEKGIELWEKWDKEEVFIVRIHMPFRLSFIAMYQFPRSSIEKFLFENSIKRLSRYKPIAKGAVEVMRALL